MFEHDREWHKETRRSIGGDYDAIWQDGFWKGVGATLVFELLLWIYTRI
jgi:hypothetical protein